MTTIVPTTNFFQSLRDSRRRVIQKMLVRIGQAEATDDTEYERMQTEFIEMYKKCKEIVSHLKAYTSNLIATGYVCTLLANDMTYLKSKNTEIDHNAQHNYPFLTSLASLDTEARGTAEAIMGPVISQLEDKIQKMKEVKTRMKERANYKLDYDSACRKLCTAQNGVQSAEYARREAKLQAARQTLSKATKAIQEEFLMYERLRERFIDAEMDTFRSLQLKFFNRCTTTFQETMSDKHEIVPAGNIKHLDDFCGPPASAS